MMKAITRWQPWAFAVIYLGKGDGGVENRPRSLGHVGEVAVHVGLNWDEERVRRDMTRVCTAIRRSRRRGCSWPVGVPLTIDVLRAQLGAIIGAVEIVEWARRYLDNPWRMPEDKWCALLRGPQPIARPVPERTAFHRGIWTVPPDVERQVRAQLGDPLC